MKNIKPLRMLININVKQYYTYHGRKKIEIYEILLALAQKHLNVYQMHTPIQHLDLCSLILLNIY